jgi:hypothetical protein
MLCFGLVVADKKVVCSDNTGKAVWQTNTASPTGDNTVICAVQNDGDVVLYKGTKIWATNTKK